MRHRIEAIICFVAMAALSACAGTPPAGTEVAKNAHCVKATGSLLCQSADDMPTTDNQHDPSMLPANSLKAGN